MILCKQKKLRDIVASAISRSPDSEITANLQEQWLSLMMPFAKGWIHGRAVARCAWELLERNTTNPGAVKIIIAPGDRTVQAAVDVRLDLNDRPEESLAERIEQAMTDLDDAVAPGAVAGIPESMPTRPDLESLVVATGWEFHHRGDGRFSIVLDVPGSAVNAMLDFDTQVHATVELARPADEYSELSRQAVGLALLQVGGLVRLVRPTACDTPAGQAPVLQAPLGPAPSPAELNDALAALSIACRMCRREVVLLSNESIASRYLSLQGASLEAVASA